MGWHGKLSKGSNYDHFTLKKHLECFSGGINITSHQSIGGEWWYVTYLCLLEWPRSLLKGSDFDPFLRVKTNTLSAQCHIYKFNLTFSGSVCMPRGPVFSEQYYILELQSMWPF